MFRITAAAALALGLMTGGVHAAEHEVAIVAGAFFPETTYVQPGDTVVIYNTDDVPRLVFGDQYHFVTPTLNSGEEYTLTIVDAMPNQYYGKSITTAGEGDNIGESGIPAEDEADTDETGKTMRGVFSFAPAPLDED
ncbi:hypothetical protein M8756_12220 [Lutimaribacter sp. EGI FJ00015]|uniref:Uncharacterized protein n=1 Tax=Lutimaribacter degradans TaxID=2945989 RepID=A0ACC5ZX76_9RHOB|nr:hypothetical protein [Lutimaribacter sp. EGI FJ00013]MCM2562907.1 hypothetical protein [Lutimaribacter sp. EGI FJ00013]MCO0614074.1 hypothetical protein [Lutimaribacter sp. EGI FJ00015]MCO0636052.1 hypothetical protein [Lutimaribacter sp. EGI FJ00014]